MCKFKSKILQLLNRPNKLDKFNIYSNYINITSVRAFNLNDKLMKENIKNLLEFKEKTNYKNNYNDKFKKLIKKFINQAKYSGFDAFALNTCDNKNKIKIFIKYLIDSGYNVKFNFYFEDSDSVNIFSSIFIFLK